MEMDYFVQKEWTDLEFHHSSFLMDQWVCEWSLLRVSGFPSGIQMTLPLIYRVTAQLHLPGIQKLHMKPVRY